MKRFTSVKSITEIELGSVWCGETVAGEGRDPFGRGGRGAWGDVKPASRLRIIIC